MSVLNEGKFQQWQKIEPTENRRATLRSSEAESRLEGIRISFLNIKQDVRLKCVTKMCYYSFSADKSDSVRSDIRDMEWFLIIKNFF